MESNDASSTYSDDFVKNNPPDVHHGIPAAVFFDDVPAMVKQHGAQKCLERLNVLHNKYKFWESKFIRSRNVLLQKIPEIKRAIEAVTTLKEKDEEIKQGKMSAKESLVNYELADQLFAKAHVEASSVCIWLGASVMVEYPFDEALALLKKNLETAEKNLKDIDANLVFLRDQINVSEVNMTRVYNEDVRSRRVQTGLTKAN
mmetsp:Transcript_12144/g.20732  ORF Transcript_12144/g.20732 Transcript_12144/m.20732 type:complete len:202 (-) Transcript_12144:179-784(-)|eukprot:CAMPEP_0184700320 /NCGR_PEP_ID=MMETSP0313-20130426/11904_1 /TAXON_ID=2792 /ORGANISM="Porphyridium aerugineum, Strain SAG 1380-2" /LENGTH=201 /DNA_ID=CAMNT_0027159923 /DNA_START=101 /DNA_END=706 /DNA_ORIENTATION=-